MRASRSTVVLILAAASLLWTAAAQATPAFSRKYEQPCSACHTAWPLLNKAGRRFKEDGYRFLNDAKFAQKIDDDQYWGRTFPIGALVKSRPYDKKESADDPKLRAIHEVELLVAGVIGDDWSGFLEYEAEDETGFELEFAHAAVSWHYSKAFNLTLANAPSYWTDSYDTFYQRRLTRNRPGTIDSRFGSADNGGRLRSNRQQLAISGRPVKNVFYLLGLSAASGDAEGENPQTLFARAAVDVAPNVMLGAFWLNGSCDPQCDVARDFSRAGVDVQADIDKVRLTGAFIAASDDVSETVDESNNAAYVQALLVMRAGDGDPSWVPLVRYDMVESNDGRDESTALTVNLQRYFRENVKAYVEYFKELDVPNGQEDSRLTLQLELGL